jgi:hypothetical protein
VGYFVILKKLPRVINHPMGEYSPHLGPINLKKYILLKNSAKKLAFLTQNKAK